MKRDLTLIVNQLRHRAETSGDTRGYTFLTNGENEGDTLTYGQLDRRSREIAVVLQQTLFPGDRALLMYGAGLDFVAGFFGCLYAGVIAVPAYPPPPAKPERCLPRLRAIVAEAGIRAILCSAEMYEPLKALFKTIPELDSCELIIAGHHDRENGNADVDLWRPPASRLADIAFLQYTSGSTAIPKGVMVSHQNILHNLAYLDHCTGNDPDTVGISWLPTYHDMGLFAGILFPLFKGCPSYLMSPISFLQKPARWLRAMSRYRGTISGGPNFAYDLCAERAAPEQLEGSDLGSWRIAYNGAEPIRMRTMERFWQTFSPHGFQSSALRAVYGLAEATVFVAGGELPENWTQVDLKTRSGHQATDWNSVLPQDREVTDWKSVLPQDRQAKDWKSILREDHQGRSPGADSSAEPVSCGAPCCGTEIVIADPNRLVEMPPGEVGEIWIRSPSVAAGYWNRAAETETTFDAHLAESGEGPFLRTGDLGFLREGNLVVTGRIKDLIIIRGRKYYPQDIEQTVEASHQVILPNGAAAMSVSTEDGERLVIVAEMKRRKVRGDSPPDRSRIEPVDAAHSDIIGSIRQAVSEQHELQTFGITLVARGAIPKTSSGKIQRHACRNAFLAGTLDSVAHWMQVQRKIEFSHP